MKKFHSIFWRIMLYLGLAPIVILDYVLGFLFGFKNFYYKGMDDNLRKLIKIKTGSLLVMLGMNSNNKFEKGFAKNSDFFRIIHHYVYENSINHQSKMVNYVALYGFLRTLCVTINILFYYLIIHYTFFTGYSWAKFWLILFTGIVSYIFFMAFMKFYRRYTLEGLMLVAVDKELGK